MEIWGGGDIQIFLFLQCCLSVCSGGGREETEYHTTWLFLFKVTTSQSAFHWQWGPIVTQPAKHNTSPTSAGHGPGFVCGLMVISGLHPPSLNYPNFQNTPLPVPSPPAFLPAQGSPCAGQTHQCRRGLYVGSAGTPGSRQTLAPVQHLWVGTDVL